jgi:hypothetical protein
LEEEEEEEEEEGRWEKKKKKKKKKKKMEKKLFIQSSHFRDEHARNVIFLCAYLTRKPYKHGYKYAREEWREVLRNISRPLLSI